MMLLLSAIKARRTLSIAAVVAGCSVSSTALAVTCSVSTQPANFGVYNPLLATPASTTGSVDVACSCTILVDCVAFSYRIDISAGQSGNTSDRRMRAGNGQFRYNLYTDANYSSIWGTGSAGMSMTYLIALFGAKQTNTVFARAPASQTIPPGAYTDTPMVTITY